jgi:hypothetical protein
VPVPHITGFTTKSHRSQGCTDLARQVAQATVQMAWVCSLLHVTFVAPRSLSLGIDFCKICALLTTEHVTVASSTCWLSRAVIRLLFVSNVTYLFFGNNTNVHVKSSALLINSFYLRQTVWNGTASESCLMPNFGVTISLSWSDSYGAGPAPAHALCLLPQRQGASGLCWKM